MFPFFPNHCLAAIWRPGPGGSVCIIHSAAASTGPRAAEHPWGGFL